MRKDLFKKELKSVLEHNAKNLSWKQGMNKYSVMTPAEKKGTLGRSKAVKQATRKDSKFKSASMNLEMKPVKHLPKSVDWRDKGVVSAVKDQGHCGSCWAFAATATVESAVAISTGLLFDLSPEQIAMCASNPDHCGGTGGCSGATAEIAFSYLQKSEGHYEEFQYPYTSYSGTDYDCQTSAVSEMTSPKGMIDGYVQLPENNYTALMNAIATVGPIAISVDASVWHNYESGVYDGCNQVNPDIDHAVVLVGYGEEDGQKYWLVRNSWSASYGEAGYIKVLRTDDEESRCGQDITPQDGTACDGQTEPVTVCGTCGILYDSAYVTGASAL
jgi:cathepsin L